MAIYKVSRHIFDVEIEINEGLVMSISSMFRKISRMDKNFKKEIFKILDIMNEEQRKIFFNSLFYVEREDLFKEYDEYSLGKLIMKKRKVS